ncbi:MAG: helix-hairpin-helix domain-containing protein, partial [Lutibacter sp.]|nr:helix-hairpin-helix domain-containing protein [Lutibacter sp.]
GEKLAARIVKYRAKLQGFSLDEQLLEVWYLDPKLATRILRYFKVKQAPVIDKINVNEASFKELLAVVYIDYKLTKKILEYREEVAEIQSLEALKKIKGFPRDKFDRIALYLEAK